MTAYYSALKFLKFKVHLQGLEDGRVMAPVHIRVKPTYHCNHKCWYCAYRADDLALGGEMNAKDSIPETRMLALSRDFVDIGVKAVTFSGGGEPLLYKPLPEVIDILADAGIRVAALTNGSNLKGRVSDTFARHGTWIRISLDAWDNPSYVKSRGAKDKDFARLIHNIKSFTARDTICVLCISLIVGRDNYQHIWELCSLLKDRGVSHVKISGAVVSNDVAGNNTYHLPIKTEVTSQIAAAKELCNTSFSVLDHYHDLEARFEKPYQTCPSLQLLTVVGADQYVDICQDKAYTELGRMGPIADRVFKDFWFSVENQQFLKNFSPETHCAHHCVSHAKNLAIHEYLSLDQEHLYFV